MSYQTWSFLGFVLLVVLMAYLTVNTVFDGVFVILDDAISSDETGVAKAFFGGFAEGYDKISLDIWTRE